MSRSRATRQLTSSQAWCSSRSGALNTALASRHTSTTPRSLVLPTKWLCFDRPCSRSTCITSLRTAVGTWISTPSSSLNKAFSVSSARRAPTCPAQFFESPNSARLSLMPSPSVTSMSTFRLSPRCPAKAISQAAAHRPPSLRSWYASSRPWARSWLIAATSDFSSAGSSRSGTSSPNWSSTCASIEPAMRMRPCPRSTSTSVVSPACSCGVSVPRTSDSVAKAETISDTGAVTCRASSPSVQRVRIDRLSLPTGTLMPSAGHSSMPTALTVSYSAASSPGSPQAAIQLQLSFTRGRSMGAASRLVMASATAMRPEAGASREASGERSPMAMASPWKPL